MKVPACVVVALMLGHAMMGTSSADSGFYSGPLFDAHTHILQAQGRGRSGGRRELGGEGFRRGRGRDDRGRRAGGEDLVGVLREAGVYGVFLFGEYRDVVGEQKRNPDFVFPYAELPKDPVTHQLDLEDDAIRFVEEQLRNGGIYGIGEIPVHHAPTKRNPDGFDYAGDHPALLRVWDLASKYGVPVNIHLEHEYVSDLEKILNHNPKTIVIWAHMGDADAATVGNLMRRYPNLHADISCRNPIYDRARSKAEQSLTDQDGRIKEEWKALFEEFPDRFLFGLDLGAPPRTPQIRQTVEDARSLLGQLSPSTAEKIACKNAKHFTH